MIEAVFAIPGDLDAPTGGYAYARKLIAEAEGAGLRLRVLPLPGDFPDPSPASIARAEAALGVVAPDTPILVDGLAFGAMPEAALARVRAPMAALLHHPLFMERDDDPERAEALRLSERAALRRAVAIVTTSDATRADAVAHLGADPARVTVAPPGLDRVATRAGAAPDGPPLILSVGSQIPRKGHDVLIAALDGMTDRSWRAVIAGADDRDRAWSARLSRRIAESGLSGRVRLTGAMGREALDDLYAQAALFCLPSRHEGYGMVFAEAMAHGLPVVAADIAAAREVIAPGAGVLVPRDDAGALAGALRALLDDPARRREMAEAARAHAAALPGWDDTARRIARVLAGLLPA